MQKNFNIEQNKWMRVLDSVINLWGNNWGFSRSGRSSLRLWWKTFILVLVPSFTVFSAFGLALTLAMVVQFWSGFMLALFFIPEASFSLFHKMGFNLGVWFWHLIYAAHVAGVDTIFVLSYIHILKKIYIKNFSFGDVDGWFTGSYAFLVYHGVVFLGIVISANHLGDVTLMIGANIFWSLLLCWHKTYHPIFLNKHLCVDEFIRMMIAHYLVAWYYLYLIQLHLLFVHDGWEAKSQRAVIQETTSPKSSWGWDALKKEFAIMATLYFFIIDTSIHWTFFQKLPTSYSNFEEFGEGEVEDINFYIVAPHWYFRAHMGLLTVCAKHYEGLFWLLSFYLLLCFMPHIYLFWSSCLESLYTLFKIKPATPNALSDSKTQEGFFLIFVGSLFYVAGTLPCGRFYYDSLDGLTGNSLLKISYEYIYIYLGFLAHLTEVFDRVLRGFVSFVSYFLPTSLSKYGVYGLPYLNFFSKLNLTKKLILLTPVNSFIIKLTNLVSFNNNLIFNEVMVRVAYRLRVVAFSLNLLQTQTKKIGLCGFIKLYYHAYKQPLKKLLLTKLGFIFKSFVNIKKLFLKFLKIK